MQDFKVIGLMSGTSMDGVDIAFCRFQFDHQWHFTISHAETIEYSSEWSQRLSNLMKSDSETLIRTDREYGKLLGKIISGFIQKNNVKPDLIASHGHTIFHQPQNGFTLQIGDGNVISAVTGLPVVFDFRSGDVALGGQGAPLVPIGDRLLFPEFDLCLNLGGIANISFEREDKRIAFDICPANIPLNHLAALAGKPYDKDGFLARKGKPINQLLNDLNRLEFYHTPPPKSLGREWIDREFFPILFAWDDSIEHKIRTVCEHIAVQIAAIVNPLKKEKMLITGGGAKNKFLTELIASKVNAKVVVPEEKIIDFKEALIFAFLGVLRWRNETNILSSVTGASRDSCGGIIVRI